MMYDIKLFCCNLIPFQSFWDTEVNDTFKQKLLSFIMDVFFQIAFKRCFCVTLTVESLWLRCVFIAVWLYYMRFCGLFHIHNMNNIMIQMTQLLLINCFVPSYLQLFEVLTQNWDYIRQAFKIYWACGFTFNKTKQLPFG